MSQSNYAMSSESAQNGGLSGLPHREPFLFVSEVVEIETGVRGSAVWRVSGSEDFFAGHFPGNPVVPGVLLGEALAQLAGLVAFSGPSIAGERGARLARIDVKFPLAVVPPAEIQLQAVQTRQLDSLVMFDVRATVSGNTVVIGSLVLATVGAGDEPGLQTKDGA